MALSVLIPIAVQYYSVYQTRYAYHIEPFTFVLTQPIKFVPTQFISDRLHTYKLIYLELYYRMPFYRGHWGEIKIPSLVESEQFRMRKKSLVSQCFSFSAYNFFLKYYFCDNNIKYTQHATYSWSSCILNISTCHLYLWHIISESNYPRMVDKIFPSIPSVSFVINISFSVTTLFFITFSPATYTHRRVWVYVRVCECQ